MITVLEKTFFLRGVKKLGDFSPFLAFFHHFPGNWLFFEVDEDGVCLVWYSGSLLLNFSRIYLSVPEIETKKQCLPAFHFWPSSSHFAPFLSKIGRRLLKKNSKSSMGLTFLLYTWFPKWCPYRRKSLPKKFGQIRSPSLYYFWLLR